MYYLNAPVTKKEILLVDGCRKVTKKGQEYFKISFHVIVNSKYRFKNAHEANLLLTAIQTISNKLDVDQETVKYIDASIYASSPDKWKKLRCVLNKKDPSDTEILRSIDHNRKIVDDMDVFNYCLGHVDDADDTELIENDRNLLAIVQKKPLQRSKTG